MARKLGLFKIYTENPDVCKMLILIEDDKLIGRALVWKLSSIKIYGKDPVQDSWFMDRQYTIKDSDVEKFRNYAKEKGWIYKSSNKTVLVGTSYLTYQILSHTANSVFIVMTTTTFNDNDNLVSTMTEVYGRNPAVDKEYKLIRTTVKYNNPRRNEVVIE